MLELTIFTPTYNRAFILEKAYLSLQSQTKYNFEWLIVDDGSTDNTEELIGKWLNHENKFSIRYYKKENGGKPRAINYGAQIAKGKYFFVLDSDDFLKDDAVEKLLSWCNQIDDDDNIVGAGAGIGYPNGEYIKGVPPKVSSFGFVDATNLERAKYDLDADMCEAYKLEIFQKYRMAEWHGETFAPEQIALNEMALDGYQVRWHSDIIYVRDYLDDGLTKGSQLLLKKNPMGYAMMYNHMLKYPNLTTKEKYKISCQYIALSIVGKHPEYLMKSNNKLLTIIALPIGVILAIRRKIQFRKVK